MLTVPSGRLQLSLRNRNINQSLINFYSLCYSKSDFLTIILYRYRVGNQRKKKRKKKYINSKIKYIYIAFVSHNKKKKMKRSLITSILRRIDELVLAFVIFVLSFVGN